MVYCGLYPIDGSEYENLKVAQNYRVMSIPTFIVFKNGEVVVTAIGAMSKNDLESKINAVL